MGAFDDEHTEGSLPPSTSTSQAQPLQSDEMTGTATQHDKFRQGRQPRAQPSGGRPLHLHLANQDEADITLNDLEAGQHGPLTEEQLK